MILKKSNILLIVIAIFLLISIGSACANENIADDSDVKLADGKNDVVLSDTDDNVPDEKTTQEKVNTTIETDKEKYEYKQDSSKDISVQVKDNASNNVDVNKTDLSVVNGNKSVSFEYTSSVIRITEALPVGNYNLTINYLGNENYINSSKVISLKIYGNNTIETQTSVVCDGKTIEIPVKVTNGVDDIELIENKFNLTLVYLNETGNISNLTIKKFSVVDGKIKFSAEDNGLNLIAGNLTVNYTDATESKTVAIKVSTEVKAEADKDKFKSEEIKNISIEVLDGQENQLKVNKTDLKVFDNGKEITNFKFNGTHITLDLAVGVHNVTVSYIGNATYNASSCNVGIIKVSGNNTLNVPETVESNGTSVDIPINLTDGADDITNLLNDSNTQVILKYADGNETITVDWTKVAADKKFTIDVTGKVPATVVVNYTENGRSTIKNVKVKYQTSVTITPGVVNITEGKNATFTIQVISVDGKIINITKENLTISKTGATNKFDNATGNMNLTGLKKGIYNITITFKGNDVYAGSKGNVIVNVRGTPVINTNGTSVSVNSTKKGEIQITYITDGVENLTFTKDDLNVTVSYKDGNVTKNIPVEWDLVNGTIVFTLDNGNFTTATLTIDYKNGNGTKNITVNRVYNGRIEIINNKNEYKTGNFTFRLVDVDDGSYISGKTVKLTTVGNIRAGFSATTDANGIASFKTANLYEFNNNGNGGTISLTQLELTVGNHTVDIETEGNVKSTKVKTNLTITPGNFKIVVNPYKEYYGTDKAVTVTVTNSLGETVSGVIVKLTIDKVSGEYYLQTNASGIGSISIYNKNTKSGLVGGDYKFTASNNDTKNIVNTTSTGTVTVMKIPVVINGKDVTIYYNSGTTYTVKVTKNGKGVSGVYILVRLYTTSSKYNDYLFQTDKNGQFSFSASLAVGKHKVIVSSADNRYEAKQITKTITVKKASAKITAPKVTDYYKGVKYLTVKLTNTKNKKAIYDGKLNIKVFVSSNRYYNYKGNTGMNGQLKLSLDNLKPGTYKVVITDADNKNFAAKQVTSKIVIKKAPTKFVIPKTAKKSKKILKITVKNKKTNKIIKGVKIKVKVYTGKKAKTYTLKTDSKGIAKLNIKKLKLGKHKVIVTSANKYCTAKKTTKTVTIKK